MTPLFEVERDLFLEALISELPDPFRIHRSGMRAALPAADDPVELGVFALEEWLEVEGAEQRLATQKFHFGRTRK